MKDKLESLRNFLYEKQHYYNDFAKYELALGNIKNADTLNSRSEELTFVITEINRLLNQR